MSLIRHYVTVQSTDLAIGNVTGQSNGLGNWETQLLGQSNGSVIECSIIQKIDIQK
jgi:hypothetical protein